MRSCTLLAHLHKNSAIRFLSSGAKSLGTKSKGWLRGLDLNQRPLGYEPNELPDCSTPRLILSRYERPVNCPPTPPSIAAAPGTRVQRGGAAPSPREDKLSFRKDKNALKVS